MLVIALFTWKLMDTTKFPNFEEAVILIVEPIFSKMEAIPVINNEHLTSAMFNIDAHFLVIRQT